MVSEGGLEPPPSRIRPSNVRVCLFHHRRIVYQMDRPFRQLELYNSSRGGVNCIRAPAFFGYWPMFSADKSGLINCAAYQSTIPIRSIFNSRV